MTRLSLGLGDDGRSEHLEKDLLSVWDDFVEFVGGIDQAQDKQLLVFGLQVDDILLHVSLCECTGKRSLVSEVIEELDIESILGGLDAFKSLKVIL